MKCAWNLRVIGNMDHRQAKFPETITKKATFMRIHFHKKDIPFFALLEGVNKEHCVGTNGKDSICPGLRPRDAYSSQESQKVSVHLNWASEMSGLGNVEPSETRRGRTKGVFHSGNQHIEWIKKEKTWLTPL